MHAGSTIPSEAPPGRWNVDGPGSALWVSTSIGSFGSLRGRFHRLSGTVEIGDDPADGAVQVEVDTASLSCGRPALDRVLRWCGVLDTARNPWIRFRSTAVRPDRTDARGWLDGTLSTPTGSRDVTLRLLPPVALGPSRTGFRARGELAPQDCEALLGTGRGLLRDPLGLAMAVEAVHPSPAGVR